MPDEGQLPSAGWFALAVVQRFTPAADEVLFQRRRHAGGDHDRQDERRSDPGHGGAATSGLRFADLSRLQRQLGHDLLELGGEYFCGSMLSFISRSDSTLRSSARRSS